MDLSKWEQPAISVDVVPLQLDKNTGQLKSFIAERQFEPFKGQYALPGVLLSPHEQVAEAAQRALKEKTHFEKEDIKVIKVAGVADNPNRDPRGATLSVIHIAIVDNVFTPTHENVKTLPLNGYESHSLPFDHTNLIRKAVEELHSMFMVNIPLSKALLGDAFRTTDVYNVYREMSTVLQDEEIIPDLSNLSRNLKNTQHITRQDSTSISLGVAASGRGRPASLWSWV